MGVELISMVEYVKEYRREYNQEINTQCEYLAKKSDQILKYAEFLSQPLKLEMFIPCDEKGRPIQEPTMQYNTPQYYEAEMCEYQKNLDKVIFEGFRISQQKNMRNEDIWTAFSDGNKVAFVLVNYKFPEGSTIEQLNQPKLKQSKAKELGLI